MRASLLLFFALMALSASAAANPRPFPFTYHYATTPEGGFEAEQYLDYIPVRVSQEGASETNAVPSARMWLETEFELGLTDRLELGWYFVFQQAAGATVQPLRFMGIKQRLRYRLGEAGDWPVDVGLYLEFVEFHNELEVEEKLLLEKQFGKLRMASNLWFEHEYLTQVPELRHLYNPTFAVGYEFSPSLALGAEYWMRGRFGQDFSMSNHYLGPTLRAAKGEYWFSAGVYAKVDDLGEQLPVDSQLGRVWVRTLIGIGL